MNILNLFKVCLIITVCSFYNTNASDLNNYSTNAIEREMSLYEKGIETVYKISDTDILKFFL